MLTRKRDSLHHKRRNSTEKEEEKNRVALCTVEHMGHTVWKILSVIIVVDMNSICRQECVIVHCSTWKQGTIYFNTHAHTETRFITPQHMFPYNVRRLMLVAPHASGGERQTYVYNIKINKLMRMRLTSVRNVVERLQFGMVMMWCTSVWQM